MKNTASLIIGIVASICFVLAAAAIGGYYYKTKKPQKTISVVGLAEKDFTSDLIVWTLDYSALKPTMKEAYSTIKEQNKIVKDYLISKGIQANEIDFKSVSANPDYDGRYEYDANGNSHYVSVFKGYRATQNIRIESKNVDLVEKVEREVAELYDQDINLNSNSPSYYYTKLADLKIKMLEEASKDARNRAQTITKNAGAKLDGLVNANMGVFQITAPNSSDEDYTWGGAFNTSSKQTRASINMRLTYEVK